MTSLRGVIIRGNVAFHKIDPTTLFAYEKHWFYVKGVHQ